jgi:hypothetical protein
MWNAAMARDNASHSVTIAPEFASPADCSNAVSSSMRAFAVSR